MSAEEQLQAFLGRVPYIRFLGMRAELAGDELTGVLPFSPHLIGNTLLPALHGGVIGAFLEMTALAQLAVTQSTPRVHKT
ncbi:MAG: PaaI family thioesterase, partial [Phenylobacterium sp.]|nr:PaaI family thioesterase [Phenylobacterium sp.]